MEKTKESYKPVPVETARTIAEQHYKSIVIILAHDPIYGMLHTTTYGASPQDKAWAAQGGELASKALGILREEHIDFEDYRLEQAQELLAGLKLVMKQIEEGKLVRNTTYDDSPDRPMYQTSLVMALKTAHDTIKTAEQFLGTQ